MDTSSPEFQEALRDHAKSLGVDPDSEGFLLPLVQEALLAELPPDWEQGETEDGTLYYFNTSTEESIWEHPLDAHYRELIQTKKQDRVAEKPHREAVEAVESPKPPAVTSSVDVYSFDDVSDEDEPKAATKTPSETRKSRIGALFDNPSAQTPVVHKPVSALPTTSTPVTGFGFGRDRSWLLDGDDDDTPPKPLVPAATATVATTPTSSISFLQQDTSVAPRVEEKPSVTTPISSLNSFGSRRLASSTPSSSATGPSDALASLVSLTPQQDAGQMRGADSRRSGAIHASEKSPFFTDSPRETATPSGSTSPMTLAKLQGLEKKLEDATRELQREQAAHAETTKQLATAQLDAKESNYLKMKVSELKAKLGEQDAQDKQQRDELTALKRENDRLSKQQSQKLSRDEAAQKQREALEAKQIELDALQRHIAELQTQHEATDTSHAQALAAKENALVDVREQVTQLQTALASEREQRVKEIAAVREQHTTEASALRQQLTELERQLQTAQRTAEDSTKRCEQLGSVQDKLRKQETLARELEDASRDLKTQAERAARDADEWRKKHDAAATELEAQRGEASGLRAELLQTQSDAHRLASSAEQQQQQQQQALERERLTAEAEAQAQARIQRLQTQLSAQLDEHSTLKTQLQTEIRELRGELAGVQAQELKPLEKQRDQLQRELERTLDRASGLEKELRVARQDLSTQTDKTQQLEVEVDVLVRREQQRKAQQEALSSAKSAADKQLADVQDELLTAQHDRRVESDKLSFRVRELESQVAQKEYEGARLEERFAKAEAWHQKEAARVEKRDAQLLELREQLTALQARNVEAEAGAVLQELREAKRQADEKAQQLQGELSEQREAGKCDALRHAEELKRMQQAVEWQLPQLAQACVTRSSDEWARKCRAVTQQVRDELTTRALEERNALVAREHQAQQSCERLEHKLKAAVAESEFLRREVHRLEDNSKVLLEQLHTIRVYLTQRPMVTGAANAAWAWPGTSAAASQPCAGSTGAAVGGGATPLSPFSDYATVNQLNAQLNVLHAQFQQLFDASEQRRDVVASTRSPTFSPSERFEIPSSPQAKAGGGFSKEDATRETEEDATVQRLALDALLEQKLATNEPPSASSPAIGDVHRQQEELLTSLESLGVASGPQWLPVASSGVAAGSGAVMGTSSTGDALRFEQQPTSTLWYQQDYWRHKYQ